MNYKIIEELAKRLKLDKDRVEYLYILIAFTEQVKEIKAVVKREIKKYKCGKHKRFLKVIEEL